MTPSVYKPTTITTIIIKNKKNTATVGPRTSLVYCGVRVFPQKMHFGSENWGKIGDGVIGF